MNRRFCKSLSLWIVPLLLLRALIPAGFMLAADANGLSLAFCPASTSQSTAAHSAVQGEGYAGHHVDHDNDLHPADHASSSEHDAPCPFSLAAIAAAGDVPYFLSAAAIPADEPVEFVSAPTSNAGPLRADRIRGPPSLA